jgi:hypothetical protein
MSGAAPESIALPRQGSHRHAHAIDQRPREHPYRQRQTRVVPARRTFAFTSAWSEGSTLPETRHTFRSAATEEIPSLLYAS